ncbi:LexA family protein [Sphingomonas sp. ERG5]|uniref:LexA family protein n=1 Tax=Sphingomonas sp. ERG5 TaxID=1381597 RepID=UPI00054C13C8|nr:hypothetical protein [Sphingomonas sp. ERG5]
MTPLQLKLLDAVRDSLSQYGYSPRIADLAAALRVSLPRIGQLITELVDGGHLNRAPNKARGLSLPGVCDLRSVSSEQLRDELARRGEVVGALSVPARRILGRGVTCAADCCDIEVKVGHLMCRDHWLSLPFDLRQSILAAHSQARRTGAVEDADCFGELVRQARELTGWRVAA